MDGGPGLELAEEPALVEVLVVDEHGLLPLLALVILDHLHGLEKW